MLGAILGAAGSVASSLIGANSAKKQAKLQKEFAQEGIQWKVADAQKAGVHPLFALGANTHSYSPVSVGGPDMSWLGDMGQEIDRSRQAVSDAGSRSGQATLERLSVDRAGLENELLRAEIAKTRAQVGPPSPTPGVASNDPLILQAGDKITKWGTGKGSPAQDVEDQYADIVSNAYGAYKLFNDALDNWDASKHWSSPKWLNSKLQSYSDAMSKRRGASRGFPRFGGR